MQNIRRGHYELGTGAALQLRVAIAFGELAAQKQYVGLILVVCSSPWVPFASLSVTVT